jgi:hypothetical protein
MHTRPENNNSFKDNFQNYNYNLYAIELYQRWINTKQFRNYNDDELDRALKDYATKLIYKAQIDIIFNRKDERVKNKNALRKIKSILGQNSELHSIVDKAIQNPFSAFDTESEEETLPLLCDSEQSSAQSKSLQSKISYVNSHRLDLVWSRNMIDTLLGLGIKTNKSLQSVSANVALLNGVASYGFYFVRGGMDLMKLIKHTAFTEHEELEKNNIKLNDKLRLQWGLRYASIINDIILWGPVNFATFHYLYGMEMLGYFGNVLTVGLLFCDFSLNLYNLIHAQNKFKALKKQLENDGIDQKIINELEVQHKKELNHLKWYVYYSAALCISFFSLCTFLIPGPALSVLLIPNFLLVSSIAILTLQIILNLKDMITKLKEAGDSKELKQIAVIEGLTRICIQGLVPASLILGSLLIPATGLPPMFVGFAALAISGLIIKLSNDILQGFVLKKEIAKLTKDIAKLADQGSNLYQHEDIGENQALIQEKQQALLHNKQNIIKDLLMVVGGSGFLSSIGIGLTLAATPLAPLIVLPILTTLIALALTFFVKPKPEETLAMPALVSP